MDGKVLKQYLEEKRISQLGLAGMINVSQSNVQQYTRQDRFTAKVLDKLEKGLGEEWVSYYNQRNQYYLQDEKNVVRELKISYGEAEDLKNLIDNFSHRLQKMLDTKDK